MEEKKLLGIGNKTTMVFTGERYVPEIGGAIALEHLHRYGLARIFAKDKRVLDIACGEGYGSYLLSEVAANVIGVDNSEEAIAHAESRYGGSNIEFRAGSATSLPVESNSIDLVVSFETIEYIAEHEEMLTEVKRVLNAEGVLIVSSPNKQNYPIIANYQNPFHVKELFRGDFEKLIKRYFKHCLFAGQEVVYGSLIFPHKYAKGEAYYLSFKENLEIGTSDMPSRYEVAVASDAFLPRFGSSFRSQQVEESDIVIGLEGVISEQSEMIDGVNSQLMEIEKELSVGREAIQERDVQINELRQAVNERDEMVGRLSQTASDQAIEIAGLKSQSLQASARVRELEQAVTQGNTVIAAMRASTSWRMTWFFRWCSTQARRFGLLRMMRAAAASRYASMAFRSIVFSERLRTAMKSAVFKRTGWLFRGSLAYRAWQAREFYSGASESGAGGDVLGGRDEGADDGIIDYIEAEGKKHILVIDWTTPRPDCDAGSVTSYFFLKAFVELGYHVTFIPDDLIYSEKYTGKLRELGIRCITSREIDSIELFFKRWGRTVNIVFLYRVHIAAHHLSLVKQYAPQAKIIFDTVDLHYLREEREACVNSCEKSKAQALRTKHLELETMRATDMTIVLSTKERDLLLQEDPELNVVNIPLLLEIPGSRNTFERREHIVFIGGFLHQPNIDGVCHFVRDIWPLVSAALPSVKFRIIGSSAPDEVLALASTPNVEVLGFVEDLDPVFDACRLSVVPLRFGAGIKGKIGTSASYGVPCVSTSMGVEGMELRDGVDVLVADAPLDFAEQVIRLYSDKALWESMSAASLAFVRDRYSYESGRELLRQLIAKLG